MSSLRVTDLVVRYGSGAHATTAVAGVSLQLAAGRVLGLVGESGSGKTTVAAAVLGAVASTRGTITLGDAPVTGVRPGRSAVPPRVQMVFQDPFSSLDPRMTVGGSIAEGLTAGRRTRLRTRKKSDARNAEVAEWLTTVGLDAELADARPHQLSGGQCQRVAIARALAANPELLIADEITSALDVSVQAAILNLVRQRQRQQGLTMLVISHNLAVVRYLADDVAVMYGGRVVEQGPVADVIRAPAHPYTRALIDAIPTLDGPSEKGPAPVEDVEAADPHLASKGCRYLSRCENGPLCTAGRDRCAEEDPRSGAAARRHSAECFFPLADLATGRQA